jgi:uncharacterized membrane protein YoaK (UPF0700 family)
MAERGQHESGDPAGGSYMERLPFAGSRILSLSSRCPDSSTSGESHSDPAGVKVAAPTDRTLTAIRAATPHEESGPIVGRLAIACLFAIAGGYMDAYSYLAHGHVFANAQTGNFVLFSVYAAQAHWSQAARHLPPILAFSLGVAVVSWLNAHAETKIWRTPLLCQAFELAILAALAAVGARLPDASVVSLISFVAALQHTSFNRVGAWSFNTAMTTGNLRDATSGWVLWSAGRETATNLRKAFILSLICFSFVVGALYGGSYTGRNPAHALLPCVAVVATGFLLTCRESRRATQASRGTSI